MYRPQFSYPKAPDGTYDQDFVYSFDPYSTPALNVRFAPGQTLLRVPLQMESDAAFIQRGLKMNPSFTNFLGVQLFTPDDSPISDDLLPLSAYSANTGNPAAILEPEILSPAGASYQLNVVNRSLTQSALPLSGNLSPVLVDPVNFGHGPVLALNVPAAAGFGPFAFGGALYMVLGSNGSGPSQLEVMQSLDGGKTWAQVGAVGDPNANGAPIFDGVHTIVVAFSTSDLNVDGSINLINFDLSTLTWGPVYATVGPPTTQQIYSTYLRPDGSVVVLNNPHPGAAGAGSGLEFSVWDGTAWTSVDAGAGILALSGYNGATDFVDWTSAVVDQNTGTTHIFFHVAGHFGVPDWINRTFYQAVDSTNALQTFTDLPGNDVSPQAVQNMLWANPIIVGDRVIIGALLLNPGGVGAFTGYESLIIGTGLAAPVFSYLATPGIDPIAYNVISPGTDGENAPYLLYDGQTIFAIYPASTRDRQLRVCYTNTPLTPAVGWTSVQVFDVANVGPPFDFALQLLLRPALNLIGNSIFVTVDAQAPTSSFGTNARYSLGALIVEPIRIQLRGVKRYVRTKRTQACATNK